MPHGLVAYEQQWMICSVVQFGNKTNFFQHVLTQNIVYIYFAYLLKFTSHICVGTLHRTEYHIQLNVTNYSQSTQRYWVRFIT